MHISTPLITAVLMFGSTFAIAEIDFRKISDGSSNTLMVGEEEEEAPNLVTSSADEDRAPINPTECVLEMNGITTRCSDSTREDMAPTGAAAAAHDFSAPTDLTISNPNSDSLRFTWQDNSDVEDGFVIERLLPMTSAWGLIATVRGAGESTGSRSHTVTIRGARSNFCYQVRATRGSSRTAPSDRACASLN